MNTDGQDMPEKIEQTEKTDEFVKVLCPRGHADVGYHYRRDL